MLLKMQSGIEVVEVVDYLTGDTDFSAHITKIKAKGPDMIAVGGTWVERNGPRKAMFVSACLWATGFMVGALGIAIRNLPGTPYLRASVGANGTATLSSRSVRAGSYKVTVRDHSRRHNFRLSGPGTRKQITGVEFVGTKTITVRLAPGKYTFVCVPHADDMRGGFNVR